MSRLIDADMVISIAKGEFGNDDLSKILWLISHVPAAYYQDKVVDQFELHSFEIGIDMLSAHYVRLCDAIEIVKQGSVSDDVCKWEVFDNSLTNEPQWVYETTCGKYVEEEHTSKAFVYCPYCSKKIKVVE